MSKDKAAESTVPTYDRAIKGRSQLTVPCGQAGRQAAKVGRYGAFAASVVGAWAAAKGFHRDRVRCSHDMKLGPPRTSGGNIGPMPSRTRGRRGPKLGHCFSGRPVFGLVRSFRSCEDALHIVEVRSTRSLTGWFTASLRGLRCRLTPAALPLSSSRLDRRDLVDLGGRVLNQVKPSRMDAVLGIGHCLIGQRD